SNEAGFAQDGVRSVLRHRLERAGRQLHADVALELRHPNPLLPEVRREGAVHLLDVIEADTALLLALPAVVNAAAAKLSRACDHANPCHGSLRIKEGINVAAPSRPCGIPGKRAESLPRLSVRSSDFLR